jgi:hypothetical protein
MADSNRGWQSFNEDPKRIAAVTADDVQRVANLYFKPQNRTVALYYTKKPESPTAKEAMFAGLTEQEKVQVLQFQEAVKQMSPDEAKAIIRKLEPQLESAPPEKRNFVKALHQLLQEKIGNGGN